MNLYHLSTKSREELRILCKRDNLPISKNKFRLIQLLIQKKCFQAIRNYQTEDEIEEQSEVTLIENRFNPRTGQQELEELINGLKQKYQNDVIINFTKYEKNHYNHLYSYHKQTQYDNYGDLGEHGEQILFHGTDKDNIDSILENDLSLTIHQRHGSVYGRGIYFTNNIEFACKYSERSGLEKSIIVCLVHIGNIVKGNHRMDMLPKKEDTNRYYDTSVDDERDPTQFVKYKNHQYNFLGVLHLKVTNHRSPLLKYNRRNIPVNWSGNGDRKPLIQKDGNGSRQSTANIYPQLQHLNAKVYVINKTKNPINIYYTLTSDIKQIRSGERVFLSEALRNFFNFIPGEMISITREDCWERIRIYALCNKLQIKPHQLSTRRILQKDTFLPDQALITLLNISPTTRINVSNIQKFLEHHYIQVTGDNLGYLIHHAKRIVNVPPNKQHIMNSYINHEFIAGFFTEKKDFPHNFVNVKEFKIINHEEEVILEIL